jgi:short-subunit dehydrogenase involved in D-alanine esterification of teichoic acids
MADGTKVKIIQAISGFDLSTRAPQPIYCHTHGAVNSTVILSTNPALDLISKGYAVAV